MKTTLRNMFFSRKPAGMLPADKCVQGTATPLPDAPAKDAKHFISKNPLYGPFPDNHKEAMFGMGCFWCSENLFYKIPGVYSSCVGYAGGVTLNPSYQDVCTGQTNHNEVVKIVYDTSRVKYKELLKIFWETHDPTTLNQQGGDCGTQYRSGIYYYDAEQKKDAEETKADYQKAIDGKFGGKEISTEIVKADFPFYMAEEYHQQYDAKPGSRQYCGLRPLGVKFSSL